MNESKKKPQSLEKKKVVSQKGVLVPANKI